MAVQQDPATLEPDEIHDDPEFEQMLDRVFEQRLEGPEQEPAADAVGPYHDESDRPYVEREFTLEDFARWFGVQRLGAHPYNAVGFHHTHRPLPEKWNGLASLRAIFEFYNTKYGWTWGMGPHIFVYSGEGPYRAGIPHVYVARHPAYDGAGIKYRNSRWLHLECIWDGDQAPFSPALAKIAGQVLAILCSRHPFADRVIPFEFVKEGVNTPPEPLGLMYHRDHNPDWKPGAWPKSCPGLQVRHEELDPLLLQHARDRFPWMWSIYPGGEDFVTQHGSLVAVRGAIARSQPSLQGFEALRLSEGQPYAIEGYTDMGQGVATSSRWYLLSAVDYLWIHSSGGTFSANA